jgi:hypothetical protein
LALQMLETAQQKISRKPCQAGSRKIFISTTWRNSRKSGVPGMLPGLAEWGHIVFDDPPNLRILSKGVSFNGRPWCAGDYGIFQTDDHKWLGRIQHFLHVPQKKCNLDYLLLVFVDFFEIQGKAENLNFVYCVKPNRLRSGYIRMEEFWTMVIVAPHWTESNEKLICAIMVDPCLSCD